MPFIGRQPQIGNYIKLDAITTSATTTFNLTAGGVAVYPQTATNCIVSLNGIIQAPTDAYTISGSTIVFASALTTSDVIDFITVLGDVLNIGTPSDGTVGIAKLSATGTPSSSTFLRGDNTWGSAGATAGQVIQVVQYFSDNPSTSTTSTSYVATSHSVSITPSSASNKILLLSSAMLYANSGNTFYTIYRDINGGGYSNLFTDAMCTHSVSDSSWNMHSAHYLHSPNTTSVITYKLYFKVGSGTGYIGKSDAILSLIAMEIKG